MVPRSLRRLVLAFGLTLLATPAFAQGHGQHAPAPATRGEAASHAGGHGMEHASGWKELDEFHALMMATWHPAKQSDDLAPARAKAADMATAAGAWLASAPPEHCDTYATGRAVSGIEADARALAALVARAGSDAEVKAALAALHDRFEQVMHGCAAGGSH